MVKIVACHIASRVSILCINSFGFWIVDCHSDWMAGLQSRPAILNIPRPFTLQDISETITTQGLHMKDNFAWFGPQTMDE